MKSCAEAALHAASISSSVASLSPQRRLSFIVPENSTLFCSTIATLSRSVFMRYSRTSCPPTLMLPESTS